MQLKLLERAAKRHMSTSQIALLAREDLTIQELQSVMDYFIYQSKDMDTGLLAEEAERCINFLKSFKSEIVNSNDYKLLLGAYLPSYYEGKDFLIGNSAKCRIFKMYRFLVKHSCEEGKIDNRCLLNSYVFMLYRDFPAWHINTLLRHMLLDREKQFSYSWIFSYYPCLMDEYIYNKKNSIFYYLVRSNIIGCFKPNKKMMEKLYDYEKHCFSFTKEELQNYLLQEENIHGNIIYVLNEKYLNEKILKRYPFIKLVVEFCKNSMLKPYDEEKGIFTVWQTWQLMEPEADVRLKRCFSLLGQGFTTDTKAFYFGIEISSNYFVNIFYNEYQSIYVGENNENGWKTNKLSSKEAFMISPDGNLYCCSAN